MYQFNKYFLIALLLSSRAYTQQISKVLISGAGGQHDEDVKTSFILGYGSYNGSQFSGKISLYVNSLQPSFDYATANNYDLMIRSTTGLPTGIELAPSYPSVKLVMPAGSNSYIQVYSGDIVNSPVVVTGAGTDSNQTGYEIEFFSIDPITGSNLSSFSNGYIAGQLAYIANTLNCSFDSARTLARAKGSENGNWDFYNGFGEIETKNIVDRPLKVFAKVFLQGPYAGNDSMYTYLNYKKILKNNALSQPYNVAPWNYTGTETVGSTFFDSNPTIVDWVLVDLRTGIDSSTTIARKAAFLKKGGSIVGLNGNDTISFSGIPSGSYNIVVRHRNHLAVMSSVSISTNPINYDFTTAQAKAYGTNPMADLGSGIYGMLAGDINSSKTINATDYISVKAQIGSKGYLNDDSNVNGTVNATDYLKIKPNIGKSSQVPVQN